MRHRGFLAVRLLAAICAVGALPARAQARAPNVLVIVIDTLRADRLGAYGNTRGLTPFLDRIARQGTVFANAYAPSSWTCPSVASLFTSRYASQHHVVSFDSTLAEEEVTFAEALAQRGYLNAGSTANFRVAETHGYTQGFRRWHAFANRPGESKVRGDVLHRDSMAWVTKTLAAHPQASLLLYLHYMEPHTPYQPVEPYRSQFTRRHDGVDESAAMGKLLSIRRGKKDLSPDEIDLLSSLYDGEVASVDAELRALFADLQPTGFLDHAIVVITADHGEEFGEHGEMLHGITLYNTAIRVPLIVVAPGHGAGRVVRDNVSLIDVAPTVLDLAGAPPVPTFEGHSLVPLMAGRRSTPPVGKVLSELETLEGEDQDVRAHARALVAGGRKLLVTRTGLMVAYDLVQDPGELRAHVVEPSAAGADGDLVRDLNQMRAALKRDAAVAQVKRPLDEATKEKLRALGYQP